MLILLDCRPLQYAGPGSERSRLILAAAAALARERAVQWLYVVDHTFRPGVLRGIPEDAVLVRRALPGSIGWRWWYDRQIPRLARQYGADAIMLTGGVAATWSGVPQCLWMPERVNPGESGTRRLYPPIYRKRLAAALQRAGLVICYTEHDRNWLAGVSSGAEEKILVLPAAVEEQGDDTGAKGPLTGVEKEAVKRQYVGGKEFFLADLAGAGEEDVIHLLKAFSLFKKRQQSNMQLVFTGWTGGSAGGIRQRLETYKYRQDIHWQEDWPVSEGGRVKGAAYAVVLLFDSYTLGAPLLNAWAAGLPAIVANGGLLQETAGDAALLAVTGDPASLAAQLMLIYKDENGRTDLIRRGLERRSTFSRGRSFEALWGGIGKVFRPMN